MNEEIEKICDGPKKCENREFDDSEECDECLNRIVYP
jgi:hypothetical protein